MYGKLTEVCRKCSIRSTGADCPHCALARRVEALERGAKRLSQVFDESGGTLETWREVAFDNAKKLTAAEDLASEHHATAQRLQSENEELLRKLTTSQALVEEACRDRDAYRRLRDILEARVAELERERDALLRDLEAAREERDHWLGVAKYLESGVEGVPANLVREYVAAKDQLDGDDLRATSQREAEARAALDPYLNGEAATERLVKVSIPSEVPLWHRTQGMEEPKTVPEEPAPAPQSSDDTNPGLHAKYTVRRNDGRSGPGQKHEHCHYFVLDVDHDEFAFEAMRQYAGACFQKFPELSRDIRRVLLERFPDKVGAVIAEQMEPAPAPQPERREPDIDETSQLMKDLLRLVGSDGLWRDSSVQTTVRAFVARFAPPRGPVRFEDLSEGQRVVIGKALLHLAIGPTDGMLWPAFSARIARAFGLNERAAREGRCEPEGSETK